MSIHHVYLIMATNGDGLVKIGRSSRIDDRLRELKCPKKNVIQLADCLTKERMKATEKVLHEKYDQWRIPQSEMFNLSDEQINECRLILQSINAKAVDARQAERDAKEAEYKRKAAEQAERKAAAEREALERDIELWPVEKGRYRAKQPGTTRPKVPPKAYGTPRPPEIRDRRGQLIGFGDRPDLADPRLGESTLDPNRTHQGRPGAPKRSSTEFDNDDHGGMFFWFAVGCAVFFLCSFLSGLVTTPTTNQFDPLFDVDQQDLPRSSGD